MNLRKLSPFAAAALLGAALLAPRDARAWYQEEDQNGYGVKWPSNGVTLYINPWVGIFQSWAIPAIQEAQNRWYEQPSYFGLSTATDDDADTAIGNGESEITFTTNTALLCGDGCTYALSDGAGNLIEADIYFSANQTWTTSSTKTASWAYGGGARLLQAAAVHEMGHVAGLDHEWRRYNVMGAEWNFLYTNGDTTGAYVGVDATSGARSIYGTWSGEDLSVVHWKWDPASTGPYSSHKRTQMYAGGAALASVVEAAEPYYLVNNGQTVQVEFTLENNGATSQATTIKYYLSTNSTISTGDTLLATVNLTLYPTVPLLRTQTLTLPATLMSGQKYWLGAIVDAGGTLTEFNEANNAAYVGIKVN